MVLLREGKALATGLALCHLSERQLWFRYMAIGGCRPPEELAAYIDDEIQWPAIEHNAAAQALNEYCDDLGLGLPVRYAEEL